MRPMAKTLGGFRAALLIGWIALASAGVLYARLKSIPEPAALAILAAFLVEYPFYLVPGFPEIRKRLAGPKLPVFLIVSAVLSYLAFSLPAATFHWGALLRLAALAAVLALWYVVLPANALTDVVFLALVAAAVVGGYFDGIFQSPFPRLKLAILGHIELIWITVLVLMLQRRVAETGFGFLPSRREWRIGVLHYLYFLPAGALLGVPLGAIHWAGPGPLWKAAGTFLGFLWVIALSEEFLFRGVLQQWMEDWTCSRGAALALTSAVFGLAHLWFRGFPNWRFAIIAAVLGAACGHARNQAGGIRAGVVTHALVVTTWRMFFV